MSTQLQRIEQSLSVGSLGAYIHWVNQVPMLTAEEEQALATNLRENNDLKSARKLIMSHLRLVVRIARGYDGYGLQQADLVQEGNIGLMKAVKRFDPKVGVRLVSFAIHWIRAEIHEFVLKNWRIVKVATTKAQRKLFFNLRRLSKDRAWLSQSEATVAAEELGVPKKTVFQMEERLRHLDESFDSLLDNSDDSEDWKSPSHHLEDFRYSPAQTLEQENWEEQRQKNLQVALSQLDERSRDILNQRWLGDKKSTLHDLAAQYQVSAERIRQLEKSALSKMRQMIQH